MNNRGSALIETISSMGVFLGSLVFATTLIYCLFARHWISFVVYESLVCTLEQQASKGCEAKARKRIDRGLPLGTLVQLKVLYNNFIATTELHWQFNFMDKKWNIKKNASLNGHSLTENLLATP